MKLHADSNSLIINSLKGLAILLVVVGHVLQTITNEDFSHPIFRFIYSFHMPLFMFLSGFVTAYSPTSTASKLGKRFTRLVLPFLAWALVSFFYRSAIQGDLDFNYFVRLFFNVDNGLWFLWVLFLIHCCYYLASVIKKYVGKFSFPIVILAVQFSVVSFLGLSMLRYYILFFLIGFYFNDSKVLQFVNSYKYILLVVALAIFIGLFPYWKMSGELEIVTRYFTKGVGLIDRLCRILIALSAIVSLFISFTFFASGKTILTWLGDRSLDIYVSHQYFIAPTMLMLVFLDIENQYLQIALCSIALLVFSLSLAWIIGRWNFLNGLLLGKKKEVAQ